MRNAYRYGKICTVVAEITYSETEEGVCTIDYTEIDESLRGQGIAGRLVEAAVAEIKAQNKKVAATCSYVQKWIDDYVEIELLFEEFFKKDSTSFA